MDNDVIKQGQQLVEQLGLVKDAFIKNQQELKFSIRRDVVAAELRDMLTNHTSYYELKSSLESYIDDLLRIEDMRDVDEGKQR